MCIRPTLVNMNENIPPEEMRKSELQIGFTQGIPAVGFNKPASQVAAEKGKDSGAADMTSCDVALLKSVTAKEHEGQIPRGSIEQKAESIVEKAKEESSHTE